MGDGSITKVFEPYLRKYSPKTELVDHRVSGQKEIRIISVIEPLLTQHKLIFDKSFLDSDYEVPNKKNSFTYQLSHITEDRDSLLADDRLDSLAIGVEYILEFMSDNEEFGFTRKFEDELAEIERLTNELFEGSYGYVRPELNYGSNY